MLSEIFSRCCLKSLVEGMKEMMLSEIFILVEGMFV